MTTKDRVDFDDLKARADFRAVLAHYGLRPVGRGDQLKVACPFHEDAKPSCSIHVGKGLFHCFGCGAKGNVLDFVHRMEAQGGATVSIRGAGLTLASICGVPIGKADKSPPETRREAGAPATGKSPSEGRNGAPRAPGGRQEGNKPLGFALTLDPAHPYLAERGVPPALTELFGLGFCSKGSMAGRVAIPIRNVQGELVAYAGRWVGDLEALPEGEDKYKLPAGFKKAAELYNLHRVKQCRHLVVVEGYFGAIRLHGLRVPAVALMGSSIAEEQIALLQACPALRFLTVLMDGDEAGHMAAEAIAARIARHWWTRTLTLPVDTQPDTVEESLLRELVRTRA